MKNTVKGEEVMLASIRLNKTTKENKENFSRTFYSRKKISKEKGTMFDGREDKMDSYSLTHAAIRLMLLRILFKNLTKELTSTTFLLPPVLVNSREPHSCLYFAHL